MDLAANSLLERADNELIAAKTLKKLSEEVKFKKDADIPLEITFYSSVISHAYYCIFYAAKSYLISKSIPLLSTQGQHQQVYFKFKQLVLNGIIDKELLDIYESVMIKAEALLGIFNEEKTKRKAYTYETIPQANKSPAEDSISNAITFISHIKNLIQTKNPAS